MVLVEKSFPRGGTAPSNKKAEKSFGAYYEKKTKKKISHGGKMENIESDIEALSAQILSRKTIQENMLLAGVIQSIGGTYLTVSLPGLIVGKLFASDVSNSYSKSLTSFMENHENEELVKTLYDLFEIGEYYYFKVKNILNQDNGVLDIRLSLKPSDVNNNLHHSNMKKGMIFSGAVQEIQEHGFIIETGIKNFRCFLPIEKNAQNYFLGKIVFLKINKITHTKTVSTAICKAVSNENRKIADVLDANLDYMLPSNIYKFTIKKVLRDGLKGTILNGAFTAYIGEHHLNSPFAKLEDFEIDSTMLARLLYVMPLTKFAYLSLNIQNNSIDPIFKKGDIVDNCLVQRVGNGNVILDLNGQGKGLLSLKSITNDYIGNYDQEEILAKYHKNSTHKVRIIQYDPMDNLYICNDSLIVLSEQYFTIEDVKVGDYVTATITNKDKDGEKYFVSIGKLKGTSISLVILSATMCLSIIEKIFLATTSFNLPENTKLRCRILGINHERKLVYLTNRPEYMAKEVKILSKLSKAKENCNFLGTIVKAYDEYFLVRFFNDIKGLLYKSFINEYLQYEMTAFYEGQTMNFKILSRKEDKIILGLVDNNHSYGEIFQAHINSVTENGLEITLEDEQNSKGFVSVTLLSDFVEMGPLLIKKYFINEQIKVAFIAKNIYSIRDVKYLEENPPKRWESIKVGDILKGCVKSVEGDIIHVLLPIINYNRLVKIHIKMFLTHYTNISNVILSLDQVIYVKVLGIEDIAKTLTVSAKLADVWDGDLKETSQEFARYLNDLQNIQNFFMTQDNCTIGRYKLGNKVIVKVTEINLENRMVCVDLNGISGFIICENLKPNQFQINSKVTCCIIWIDYHNSVIYFSANASDIKRINKETLLPQGYANAMTVKGKVLKITDEALICCIYKGCNPLVFVPTKVHCNDLEKSIALEAKEGSFCRLTFIHNELPIAIFDQTAKLWKNILGKRPHTSNIHETANYDKRAKKGHREKSPNFKLTELKKNSSTLYSTDSCKTNDEYDKSWRDFIKSEIKEKKIERMQIVKQQIKPALPGANEFWLKKSDAVTVTKVENSSEDEIDSEIIEPKKKKKQTPAEKFEKAREEELRLREIEEKLANPHIQPETADQFDRLVLTNPNDSKIWINYIAFHLQATEIDKARQVARRAIKSISFREEQELINIWVTLLNLELHYGTKEAFDETLNEATKCNDSYKIYTHCLNLLSDAKKVQELSNVITSMHKKFKDRPDFWKNAATSYFKLGLPEKAGQYLHKALITLPEREHINTIVTFANLNHTYGYKENAHALIEQVITSYPKRVDVWSQYVDMLIKDKEIDSARQTLERSVSQKIPLKKMRILFKKYLEFEKKFGNDESVQSVKDLAKNYINEKVSS